MSKQANLTPGEIAKKHLEKCNKNLTLKEQCVLLGVSRSSLYYQPVPHSERDLTLMRAIDEIHTEQPTFGSRTMAHMVCRKTGIPVGRKHARTLMREMGIEPIYPKPRLSKRDKEHVVYPYLLSGIQITRPNQVWSMDITYIRMRGGFLYLTVVIDWYSRNILSWELSDRMTSDFCISAAQDALKRAVPDIINTDQGSQFTDGTMITLWNDREVQISMDHKGRCFDNIFTERFWRTIKYEEVYLRDYESYRDALLSIGNYIDRYNKKRVHQALRYRTPDEVYFGAPELLQVTLQEEVKPIFVS